MTHPLPPELQLRNAKLHELRDLQNIERLAAQRFKNFPYLGSLDDVTEEKTLRRAQRHGDLWVAATGASEGAVGFALAHPLDDGLHLAEMDVLPRWGGRGVGTALLHQVLDVARRRDVPRVTLTTFRDVPWNAPFYARHGFRHLDPEAWTPGLEKLVQAEDAAGLRRAQRTVMACDLT